MKLYLSKEFFNTFPGVNLALVEVTGVEVKKVDGVLSEKNFKEELKNISEDTFFEQKLFVAFRDFYKELGLGAKEGYPSVENLYRRFLKDGRVPQINSVVDACNKVAIHTLIPTGVFDADKIKGDMMLRFSRAGEEYLPLGGGMESLPEGIAVIADEEKILNLFPYRDSVYPKITEKTKHVVVLADKVRDVDIVDVKKAAEEVGKLIEKEAGGKAGKVFIGEQYTTRIESVDVSKKEEKKRIFSGIRATGRLHLGNYLGMVKGMLKLQDDQKYELFFAVVDLHAMTTPYDKRTLVQKTRDVVLDYLAAGLDPDRSHVLLQSKVADFHAELMLHFSTVMSVARMQHLPTFKEKVKQYPNNVTMALLNYPLLMAADILAYKSELVPVGIDQEPHLEVAREVARKMNEVYGTDFPEPKRFATRGEYVPSLLGEGKMSKTVQGSFINLTDDLETIKKRLAAAPSDSGKGKEVPSSGGVANLLTFIELFEGKEKRTEYEKQYLGEGIRYKELKQELAEAIYKELQPIQEKRRELEAKPDFVDKIIEEGAEKARQIARETVKEVREKMGLG